MDKGSVGHLFLALSEDDRQAVVDRYRMYMSKGSFDYADFETSGKVWEESVKRYCTEKEE